MKNKNLELTKFIKSLFFTFVISFILSGYLSFALLILFSFDIGSMRTLEILKLDIYHQLFFFLFLFFSITFWKKPEKTENIKKSVGRKSGNRYNNRYSQY